MRTYLIIAILFLSLSSLAQDHPFYSINDPKIKENLNKVDPKDYQNAFFNGLRYKILGDPDKALEYFSDCIRMNGKEPTPMYESAILYFNKGQLDQAQFFIESACQLEPENKWFQQLLATTYLENGQYSKAITSFKKLLKIDPKNEDWHFELASAYLLNNQARNAIKVYDDLEKYIGPYDMLFQQKKRIYSEIGDKAGAIREVEKWVVAEPKNLEALNELSELYLLSGKQAKAIQTLEKSLELKSDNAMAFIMLSDLYRNNKELDKSFDYTKKAFGSLDLGIDAKMRLLLTYYDWTDTDTLLLSKAYTLIDILSETHPNDAKPFTIAGDYFYRDDNLEAAKTNFLRAAELDPSRYPIWQQLLIISFDLKEYEEVITLGESVQELFPSQPISYYFVGLAYIQDKQYASAIDQFNTGKLMVIDNPNLLAQFYASLGDAYHAQEEIKESDEAYDKSLDIMPENTYVLNNYSYYLSLRKKKLEQAAQMMKLCVELSPGQPSYEDTYAWVFYQLKDYQNALVWIEKAISSGGNTSSTIVEHYGDILYQLSRKEEALQQWQNAQELGSESEFLDQKIADQKLYE
ncbi:MAG: tetratricopeptide repeat protein [Flavobacteriales bacterium]